MSARGQNSWIRAFVAALIVILAGMIWVNRDRFTQVEVGARMPDYEVYSMRGDTVHLQDYRGSVVVLNIWETSCGPCVREMPTLERLHTTLAPQGLEVLAVSVDLAKDSALIRQFGERFHLTFPLLHDRTGGIEPLLAVEGYPTTFIIDRKGRIREKLLGAREWDDPTVVGQLQKLLGS
jgi:peroxiredoxin